jgi:hypothetical protein
LNRIKQSEAEPAPGDDGNIINNTESNGDEPTLDKPETSSHPGVGQGNRGDASKDRSEGGDRHQGGSSHGQKEMTRAVDEVGVPLEIVIELTILCRSSSRRLLHGTFFACASFMGFMPHPPLRPLSVLNMLSIMLKNPQHRHHVWETAPRWILFSPPRKDQVHWELCILGQWTLILWPKRSPSQSSWHFRLTTKRFCDTSTTSTCICALRKFREFHTVSDFLCMTNSSKVVKVRTPWYWVMPDDLCIDCNMVRCQA